MLSREHNELITRTGPGTPGGDMMRSYWQPAALSVELKVGEPLAVQLLGEELVMFRDDKGKPQLVGRYCPHRQVDLSYGRVEDGGIRCIYHGWLMDGTGRCIDRPCEPEHLRYRGRIKIAGYPCHEEGGVILAYLGKGDPPDLPAFHFIGAPSGQTYSMKVLQECNYLQGNEGNLDPAHLSFLHTFLEEGVKENLNLRSGSLNDLLHKEKAPDIHVAETPFGLRVNTARPISEGKRYVRVTNFVMPNAAAIQGSPVTDPRKNPVSVNTYYQINWHVPIDDHTHWKYVIAHRYDGPVDPVFLRSGFEGVDEHYVMPRTRANRFRQDREEMKTRSFAGLGGSFFVHDKCVIETQGPEPTIDRSLENLGTTDRVIVNMRKQLIEAVAAVKEGRDPRMIDRTGNSKPLKDLAVYSAEITDDVDLDTEWWRAHFADGKPIRG